MTTRYQAFIQSRDGQLNYAETALSANSDREAKQEAGDWAAQFKPVADDALLLISDGHRGVCGLQPGQF